MRRLLFVVFAVTSFLLAQDRVFFGNLHSHTSYSDGVGTPAQAYKFARDVAKVDFLAITEHNHIQAEQGAGARADGILIAKDHALYNGTAAKSLISAARTASKDGKFIALYGQEFSSISSGNHVNVFDVPDVITVPNGAYDQLVTLLGTVRDTRGKQPLLQFNHPGLNNTNPAKDYGQDDFATDSEWITKVGALAHTIAILNGPHDTTSTGLRPPSPLFNQYLKYLSLGFFLAPVADQDNHERTWGKSTVARTAIIADSLTKNNLLEAMEARHVYATEDFNLRLVFKINGHLMGDRIPAPASGTMLGITYTLTDDDEADADYTIDIFAGTIGGPPAVAVDQVEAHGNTTTGTIEDIKYEGGRQYFFFRVNQANDEGGKDIAWTSPLWLEPGGAPPTVTTGGTATGDNRLVASKNRPIYHFDDCRDAANIKPANLVRGADAKRGRTLHEGCPRR